MVLSPTLQKLWNAVERLGEDELRVLLQVANGLANGRNVYGELNLRKDKRNMTKEAMEEIRDSLVYLCARLEQLETK